MGMGMTYRNAREWEQ